VLKPTIYTSHNEMVGFNTALGNMHWMLHRQPNWTLHGGEIHS
jgi:hypothetical protein